jgi:methionine-rich copper-binding protein CopC
MKEDRAGTANRENKHHRGALVRVIGGVLVLGALSLPALPLTAVFHQLLLRSEPAQGEDIALSPQRLRLVFAEPVELAVSRIQLMGGDGATVPLSAPSVERDSANVLLAGIERSLSPGSYIIRWRTAGADGHAVSDSIAFTVASGQGTSHLDHHDP